MDRASRLLPMRLGDTPEVDVAPAPFPVPAAVVVMTHPLAEGVEKVSICGDVAAGK